MIVDDSMVARAVLVADGRQRRCVSRSPPSRAPPRTRSRRFGQVRSTSILLDLEMPGAGGLRSIPRILDNAKGAQVMIVSSMAEEGAEETVAALALGAADALPKPGTGRFNGRFSEVLLSQPARRSAMPTTAGLPAIAPVGPVAACSASGHVE